jgi:hypothetical protein
MVRYCLPQVKKRKEIGSVEGLHDFDGVPDEWLVQQFPARQL